MIIDGYGEVGSYIEKDEASWHRVNGNNFSAQALCPCFSMHNVKRTYRCIDDVMRRLLEVTTENLQEANRHWIYIELNASRVSPLFSLSDSSSFLTIDKRRCGGEFLEECWNLTTACCTYVNASSELDFFENLEDKNNRSSEMRWVNVAYQGWRRIFRILRHDLFRRLISDRPSSSLHRRTPQMKHRRIV